MAHSVLPYERLLAIDERLEHAAARPVIVPGHDRVRPRQRVHLAQLPRRVPAPGHHLPARPPGQRRRETAHRAGVRVAVASLFCQFVAGYTGRSPDRRGRGIEGKPLWSMLELQELLDEWLIASGRTGRTTGCGTRSTRAGRSPRTRSTPPWSRPPAYVPVALGPGDYIELLPACLAGGQRLRGQDQPRRSYDSEELNPLRRPALGGRRAEEPAGRSAIDPYDVSRIFVRGPDGWITVLLDSTWTGRRSRSASLAWDHARDLAADGPGSDRAADRRRRRRRC